MPNKDSHPIKTIKQDPESGAVAVRCKNGLPGEWAVMTIDNGGHFASNEDVADWPVATPGIAEEKVEEGLIEPENVPTLPPPAPADKGKK